MNRRHRRRAERDDLAAARAVFETTLLSIALWIGFCWLAGWL